MTPRGHRPPTPPQKKEAAQKAGNQAEQTADEQEPPKSFEQRFERAVVMAASLANHFILESADVELITADERHNVASGNGYEHLYKILRSLATLQPTVPADSRPAAAKGKIRSLFKRAPKPRDEKREGEIEAEAVSQD